MDLTWRAKVNDEFWLTSESNVTDMPMLNGQPDTKRKAQRSRIVRRFRIRVAAVNASGHPESLKFFVEKHTHEDMVAETKADGSHGIWSPLPGTGPAKWPPEQATFTVAWDGMQGRWMPADTADAAQFAKAARDIASMLESRWLREEIPDTKVALGGSWSPADSGRLKLARDMLGESAGYSVDVTLDAATATVEDTAFFVLRGKRRLFGDLPGSGGTKPQRMTIATESDVRVSSGDVFRVMAETSGVVDLPDLGSDAAGSSIRRTIGTSERIEPTRQ